MKIKEEIGRNYHSADTAPIPYNYDDNIGVTINANSDGRWMGNITVHSHPELSVPVATFNDELAADHYAREQVRVIKTKIENQLVREFVSVLLKQNNL